MWQVGCYDKEGDNGCAVLFAITDLELRKATLLNASIILRVLGKDDTMFSICAGGLSMVGLDRRRRNRLGGFLLGT